ncbi:MAG: phosphate/phosphite/phosphonate ABC transporter substrate-binding protein [Gammaproteobacteria bacterium]|nr:phosphate/phosphite/phosphonate ABC transporter substrate-binding protein [Gammaproteobacteria bacterium]
MTFLAALLATPVLAAEPPPLQMGVLPYLSSDRLFEYFLPMKEYLEVQLGRRIVMSTAPDFKTFVQRAARGDYDIYQTAPHLALLAETEHGYRRVGRLTRELDGDVIVRRDDPARRIEDLRGRIVITPDALAITSMLGEQLLRDHGLSPGRDYRLLRASSHNNAILTVHRGGADAALASAAVFEQLTPKIKRELRVLTKTRAVPHMMIMAHPRLSRPEYQRLKSALLAFTRDGPGREFFETTGYGDMAPITDADMARLRPFLKDLQERLK